MTQQASGAPVFGEGGCKGRNWSMGSTVKAFYWTVATDQWRVKRYTERKVLGRVARIRAGGVEGWLITLVPLPGRKEFVEAPDEFNPAQIEPL